MRARGLNTKVMNYFLFTRRYTETDAVRSQKSRRSVMPQGDGVDCFSRRFSHERAPRIEKNSRSRVLAHFDDFMDRYARHCLGDYWYIVKGR